METVSLGSMGLSWGGELHCSMPLALHCEVRLESRPTQESQKHKKQGKLPSNDYWAHRPGAMSPGISKATHSLP